MEIRVHYEEPNRLKNIGILVTKEAHCLEKILDSKKRNEINANISVIIGNDRLLSQIANDLQIPFHAVSLRGPNRYCRTKYFGIDRTI